MTSLPNMDTPPLEACVAASTLNARLGGDFERVSICTRYINHGAGLERLRAVDARVPARAAIAHARKARSRIDPFLEARRHAGVDRRHLPRAVPGPVGVYSVAPGCRNHRRDHDLRAEIEPEIRRRRCAEG